MVRSAEPLAEDQDAHHSAFTKAVCLDLPYILDSVWRHAEYDANRRFSYVLTQGPDGKIEVSLKPRPYTASPAFWFFLLTLVFVAYGPTFDAWCSIVGATGMRVTRVSLGLVTMASALYAWWRLYRYGKERAEKRFRKAKPPVSETERWRRRFVHIGVQGGVLCPVIALGLFGGFLVHSRCAQVCNAVPSPVPARLQLLVLVIVGALYCVLGRQSMKRGRIAASTLLLLAMGLLLWGVMAPPWASEANQSPYLHVYGVFACLLAVLAVASPAIAHWQLGSVTDEQKEMYQQALRSTELFPGSRVDPDISTRRIAAALATGVCYHLLHFLLLPSFFVLMVPSRYVLGTFIWGCAASAWLLMTGNFTSRWQVMVDQVRRWFLEGTPLAVSVCVGLLAILRLAKVQYAATVLDAAPFGVIFTWVIMAYVLLWWFEFAVNGYVANELLGIFSAHSQGESAEAAYPATDIPEKARTVKPNHRYIVAHGAGRFAALGWFMEKNGDSQTPTAAFQTFDLVELFTRLTPTGLADYWHDLLRRIQLYFLTVNALIVIAVLGFGFGYYGHDDRHNTVDGIVHAKTPDGHARLSSLATLLKGQGRGTPAFIVAASGGGTRAAVYTATALEGLRNLHMGKRIVLVSGVSGGGVALAYFYAHRETLLATGDAADQAWRDFKTRMAEPFIGDVLEGAGEWRVVSREPLGRLLVESFERRLFAMGERQATLGDTDHMALILNTTITAHPQEDSDLLRGAFSDSVSSSASCHRRHIPYALMGGGRLIFTNLNVRSAFPPSGTPVPSDSGMHIPDVRLPYVVVQDPDVSLASASALNANFPPLFTNARVDVASEVADSVCPDRTYYVTDGGATENLGLISALYALRSALKELAPGDIPPIHIVTVEASETSYDYTPDRGIDAAFGSAKERLTGGLTQELLNDVEQRVIDATGDSKRIQVHDLALPLAFRSRGGFGTHWMFPGSVVIANPGQAQPPAGYKLLIPNFLSKDSDSAVLNQRQIVALWMALHDPQPDFCTREWQKDSRRVARWICGGNGTDTGTPHPDIHIGEWQRLVDSVKQ